MNLFKELVLSAPVSNRLQFGFNENVIVTAVDTSVRKIKGLPIKANTFITLTQVDPVTRKPVAQNEFNFFNLDPESDFVASNFIEQMTTLLSLIDAVGGDIVAFDNYVVTQLNGNDLDEYVKTKEGAKTMQAALETGFADCIKDYLGANCPLLKCKLVVNKRGFLTLSHVQGWVLPMTSEEPLPEITSQELKTRAESLTAAATPKQAKPDELGQAKPAPTAATPEKAVTTPIGFSGL